jgi:hypothetical protein
MWGLQYLSFAEILFGWPIDGVVLTIGCDKPLGADHGGGHGRHSGDRPVQRADVDGGSTVSERDRARSCGACAR